MKTYSKKDSQIATAKLNGSLAFALGKACVPAQCKETMDLIKGRNVGEYPNGEASTVQILKAFVNGWTECNLKSCKALLK